MLAFVSTTEDGSANDTRGESPSEPAKKAAERKPLEAALRAEELRERRAPEEGEAGEAGGEGGGENGGDTSWSMEAARGGKGPEPPRGAKGEVEKGKEEWGETRREG